MSDIEEQVVDPELDNNEPDVQPDEVDENSNDTNEQAGEEESTTVLVAYDLRTGEELYTQIFTVSYAERILSIPNSGWKPYEEAKAKIGIVVYQESHTCYCDGCCYDNGLCYRDGNANGIATAEEDFAEPEE